MISRALTGLGTLLWACLAVPGIAAAEPARLGLTPVGQPGTYFELTLEPGVRHASEVEAANFGTEAADARTYAADVYSIVNGGFGAELYGESASAMTRWVSYPTQRLRLEAREAVRVPFAISVPVGTPPGEYIAALVIESTEPMRSSGPLMLNQVNRSAIAVAITVPGPTRAALAIGGVAHRMVAGHSLLAFEVSNPGNVHLQPTGSFTLLNAHGSAVHSARVTMDSVYAWTGTRLEAPLAEPLPRGDYCAELSLTDAATGAHDETDCLVFSIPAATEADGPEDDGVPLPDMLPGTSAVARAAPGILLGIGGALVTVAVMVAARRRRRGQRTVTSMSETHR